MRARDDRGTFSIVACDAERRFWGVAVATMPASVGAFVPWAEWRVGAIATQADTNFYYGPRGLERLRRGYSANEVVSALTRTDPRREHRQLAVVDRRGRVAAWTGSRCLEHALHQMGPGFSCQGNLLAAASVVPAMARAFETTHGTMATRMLAALRAGARRGGDRRGHQSAAMVVAHREPWFPAGQSDYWVNLRVDRHRQPLRELGRLLRIDEMETRQYLAERKAALRRRRKSAPSGPAGKRAREGS